MSLQLVQIRKQTMSQPHTQRNRKRFFLSLMFVALTLSLTSFKVQRDRMKCDWSAMVVALPNNEAEIRFTCNIPAGWFIYSKNMSEFDGPLPTSIEIDPSAHFELIGEMTESGSYVKWMEPSYNKEVTCLQKQARYTQKIKINTTDPFQIKASVNYMLNKKGDILQPDDENVIITVSGL